MSQGGTKYLNRVKQFRKDQGLSQLKLAQKIGVARQTINLSIIPR